MEVEAVTLLSNRRQKCRRRWEHRKTACRC